MLFQKSTTVIYYTYAKILQIKSTAQFLQNRHYNLRREVTFAYPRKRIAQKRNTSDEIEGKPFNWGIEKHQTVK